MASYLIDDSAELPAWFEMEPGDLFRTHGFGAGEMFWETCEWLIGREGLVVDPGELLVAVVGEYLLPRLDPEPNVEYIGGPHNPVRAVSAEGELLGRLQAPRSWPKVVRVRRDDVLDLAGELADPASDSDRAEWAERWDLDAA